MVKSIKQFCKCGHDRTIVGVTAQRWCRECSRTYHRERYRSTYKRLRSRIANIQGSVCAICGSTRAVDIDHNHTTGLNRGFLCRSCNMAIGLFRDDVRLLKKSIRYLERKPNKRLGKYYTFSKAK